MNFEEHFLAEIRTEGRFANHSTPAELLLQSTALVWNSADTLQKLFTKGDRITTDSVRCLVQRGLNLNVYWSDKGGLIQHAICHASGAESSGWALALLDFDPLLADGDAGKGALFRAIDRCHTDVVAKLITLGVDVNTPRGSMQYTALIRASQISSVALIEILLKAGAHVNACDANGDTALHSVGTFESPVERTSPYLSAKLLLSHGADVSIKNKRGATALETHVSIHTFGAMAALIFHGDSFPNTASLAAREEYARMYLFAIHQMVRAEMATIRDGTQSDEVRRKMRLDGQITDMLDLRSVPYHKLPEAIGAFIAHMRSPSSRDELNAMRNAFLHTLRKLAEVIHESPDGRAEAAELCDKDTKSYETKRRKTKK
jgi:ankyrin repeat protein